MSNEQKRQYIHVILFLFAFVLKYTSKLQAALLVIILLSFTLFIVPKLKVKSHFYRPSERNHSQGAIMYFLVLLILVIVAPLYIVAASWAILALGDGMATLFGQHFKAKALPWSKDKTFSGSVAFVVFATLGSFILLKWMIVGPTSFELLTVSFEASVVAAIVESLPLKINDNLSVAMASALVLAILI